MAWNLDGTYFETCSCELMCPCNLSFDHVAVSGTGSNGIEINAVGSASFSYVTVTGVGGTPLVNSMGYVLNRGAGNSGF